MPLPTKPVKLPRWGDNLANPADIVEPLSGKKDIGWQDAELPPHSYMNWLFNLIYLWTAWLDSLTDQALTWTAAHVFQAGVTISTGAAIALNVIQTAGFDGAKVIGHGAGASGQAALHVTALTANGCDFNSRGLLVEADHNGFAAQFLNTGGGYCIEAEGVEGGIYGQINSADATASIAARGGIIGALGLAAPSASWQAGLIGKGRGGQTAGVFGIGGSPGTAAGGLGGRMVGGNGQAGNNNGGDGLVGIGGLENGSGYGGTGLRGTTTGSGAGVFAQGLGTDIATALGGVAFSSPEIGQWAGLIAAGKNQGADGGYGLIVSGDQGAAKRAALKIILQGTYPVFQTVGDVCAPITGLGVDTGKLYCSEGGYGFLPIGGRAKLMADGEITLNGTAAPTFIGQNINTVAIAANIVTVTFTKPMHMAPRVQITLGDNLGATLYHARVVARTTAVFTFKIRDNAGAIIDPAVVGTGLTIDFACSTY